jgi:hypothetical protein
LTLSQPTVAALYVSRKGPYWGRPDVDAWDEERDARLYDGPFPVVAHPPCARWINYAYLNFARYGGEHNRPGEDGGCFCSALNSVRTFGGVVEQPAGSRAWERYCLTKPTRNGWIRSAANEWTCEIWQSAWGHRARKKTWLLYCGANAPAELNWSRMPGTHQIGWFDRKKPTLGKVESSLTPPAFAETLLSLARNCGGAARRQPTDSQSDHTGQQKAAGNRDEGPPAPSGQQPEGKQAVPGDVSGKNAPTGGSYFHGGLDAGDGGAS